MRFDRLFRRERREQRSEPLADGFDAFMERCQRGPDALRVRNHDLVDLVPRFYRQLSKHFESTEVIANLCAVCPTCCTWLDPSFLSRVSVAKTLGPTQAAECLLAGRCVLDGCGSQEVFLTWRGSEDYHRLLQEHLERVKQRIASPLVATLAGTVNLRYVSDVVWTMWRREPKSRHIYRRRTFENERLGGQLVAWTSVVQGDPGSLREVFSSDYKDFLSELMAESAYESGATAVAHWISFGQTWDRAGVTLSLISSKHTRSDDQVLLLPEELS